MIDKVNLGTKRIPSLDGLRGIAILMVLVGHGLDSFPRLTNSLLRLAGNSTLGVNIFFILSGFLIYRLSVREIEETGGFNWRQFYLRRVLRIFPCFFFYIGFLLILMACGIISLSWPMILSASTFSLNYRHLWDHSAGNYDYKVIGHYWTLALEEQFYLTWPLLILLFVRRKLHAVLIAILVMAPLIRVGSYFLTPGSRGQLDMMFHTAFDSIAAGVLLGELLQRARPKKWIEALASNQWVLGACLFFLLILSPLVSDRFGGAYHMTVGKSAEIIPACLVITAAVSFPHTVLFRLLNWRPLAHIGVLSYSLYVWNNLFLLGEGHWFNIFPINFICVIIMALLSHYVVERPFLRLKERFHKKSPKPVLERQLAV